MAPNSFSLSTRIGLPNGLSIPQIHLGVYLMSGKEASSAVKHALSSGYRAIDSAQMYRNEKECGQAILSWLDDKSLNTTGLKREDLFFTSKLASNGSYDTTRKSIKQSVKASGLGYLDLASTLVSYATALDEGNPPAMVANLLPSSFPPRRNLPYSPAPALHWQLLKF